MDIRDLSQYVKALCGKEEQLDKVGKDDEPLMIRIFGAAQAKGQLESIIKGAASFASNAEEQLFYEFVQNAYDADADTLIFNADENYLAVYNNGKPFYTDFDPHPEREGQLFSFLAKGKSAKCGDDVKIGKYGQGSKLLYTLLTDVSDSVQEERLLWETMHDKWNGPYIISWNNRNQLANLLQEQGEWRQKRGDDYEHNILFAKIVLSYYPLSPGRDETEKWFSAQEALDAIMALNTLIYPRIKINYLDRGTALIIPLGKGKYGRITSRENIERVKTRIGGFSTITKAWKKKKELKHIWVMGKEVEINDAEPVSVNFVRDGQDFHYLFAFNPIFAGINYVNLFKGLPILGTKYQLGFIIDNDIFELDNSRQRISDKAKTKSQLTWAFTRLAEILEEVKEKEPARFDYVYKSLLATQCQEGEDAEFITVPFKQVFEPFFKKHVLTSTGKYVEENMIRDFDDDFSIPLEKIGVTCFEWIDPEVKDDLTRHRVKVDSICFSSLLPYADPSKLETWIKSLENEEYKQFHKLCDTYKSNVAQYKLFRSNLGNIYSLNKLHGNANIYYPIKEGMRFGECEHITEVIREENASYLPIIYGKIEVNIKLFRQSDSRKEDAANLLEWIVEKDGNTYLDKVRNNITLLPNRHDEFVSFSKLLRGRPGATVLFDNYQVKGYTPMAVKGWLQNPDDKQTFWMWVVNNWTDIKHKEEWGGDNTATYIADIEKVYPAGEKKLTLYLDDNGVPIDKKRKMISKRLTGDEYNYLKNRLCHDLMPYRYQGLLNGAFHKEYKDSKDIIGCGIKVDMKLLGIIYKLTDKYLNMYCTQENGGMFTISQLNKGKNYVDDVDGDLEDELENAGFYKVPNAVIELEKHRGLSDYRLASNEQLLISAIYNISRPMMLLPIVEKANLEVKNKFFNKLGKIDIDGEIGKDDLKWKTIRLAVNSSTGGDDFIGDVFNKLRHNGEELPDTITRKRVSVGTHEYDIYELDEKYKEDNEKIDSFLKCLPDRDFFIDKFLSEEEIRPDDLYNSFDTDSLSIKQLEFCIDYLIDTDGDENSLKIADANEATAALDMIKRRRFKKFDKYFIIPGVDYDKQVYAEKEILTEDELLPDNVQEWLDQNKDALGLFSRLICEWNNEKWQYIAVRRSLLNDEAYSNFAPFEKDDMAAEIDAAIKWAMSRAFAYVYDSHRYETMMGIIEHLPDDYQHDNDMPMLGYTSEVEVGSKDKPRPTFTLKWYDSDNPLLSYKECSNGDFRKRLGESRDLRNLFNDNDVYIYRDEEFLRKHGFNDNPIWTIETSPVNSRFPEFNHHVYQMWKNDKKLSGGYKICTANALIHKNFNIISSKSSEPVFSENIGGGEVGYDKKKKIVIVNLPKPDDLKQLMEKIAENISNMEFFNGPFIALQSLYIKELEKSNIDISKSLFINKEEAQQLINKVSCEVIKNIDPLNNIAKAIGNENITKLGKMIKEIKILLEELSEEQLKQLADNIGNGEGEEKESKINLIIGWIGEMIYKHYLDERGIPYDYAAAKGQGAYDFETDGKYVDVKTTVKTLTDGTAPFYLHRSQTEFLKRNPVVNYRIIRISLEDLSLKQEYITLRNEYGSSAPSGDNINIIKQRCEEIAKKYWEKAKLKDFEASSPEYAIRQT